MLVFGNDQDREYMDWLAANPRGFVLNLNTGGPGDDVVHSSSCHTLAVERYDNHTSFTKVCSLSMSELMAYSRSLGHSPRICSKCEKAGLI